MQRKTILSLENEVMDINLKYPQQNHSCFLLHIQKNPVGYFEYNTDDMFKTL